MMTFRFLNCFFFYLSYSYFYVQQYFYGHKIQKNPYGKHNAKHTHTKKKSLENFILKKVRSYFLHDLLFFCVLGMGKRAFKFMGTSHLR